MDEDEEGIYRWSSCLDQLTQKGVDQGLMIQEERSNGGKAVKAMEAEQPSHCKAHAMPKNPNVELSRGRFQ